jgi:diaminohydroxyphosphoribosylaminopyrimidine deaminase/5-amino-6-(5-phosphoribosylamino)uracil reductase
MSSLYQHGVYSVLIEGGARVASSALRAGIVDKVAWFTAPMFLGQGRGALEEYSLATLNEAPRLRDLQIEQLGEDVLMTGYLCLPG